MARKVIEVVLPPRADPTPEELEHFASAFEAIVGLRYDSAPRGEEVERTLRAAGWEVRARLLWVVEARNGAETEQGIGRTREEAFSQLAQLVRLGGAPHLP